MEHFISFVCLVVYLYLLLPLFTLILWVFGIRMIYDHLIGVGGYDVLMRLLKSGGISTLVIFAIIWGWARYNYAQFTRRGERRVSRVWISNDEEISRWLGVKTAAMEGIRRAHRMEVSVDRTLYRIVEKE